jgi:SAM-dependent methyltransferase
MYARDTFLFGAGIGFLALAKMKNMLQGYSTPKPFDVSETERCVKYDINVVEHWLSYLQHYAKDDSDLSGKNVLELGPGSDLGIGIYLLSKGCSQYNACDVNNLIRSVPDSFYEAVFRTIESIDDKANIDFVRQQLKEAQAGNPSRLNYVVRDDFDVVATVGESKIDLVFSQAAFEHFDDIEATISQLTKVCKPGAISIIEVDLKTHSRWIREKDPNNIYRYPDYLYNAFWFRGIPNRVRPFQYKEAFEHSGWSDVLVFPVNKLSDEASSYSGMNRNFIDRKNQMDYLSIMLCARKTAVN